MFWACSALAFPFQASQTTLDNGMEVVLIPMNTPGVISSQLHMRVGSRNEIDEGRSGFAHFFEHLMFSDTEARTRAEREDLLLTLGIRDTATTSYDRTSYVATVPTPSLDAHLGILADSFVRLDLTPEAVKAEAGAVYGEWRKSASDPDSALYAALFRTAFTVHPYKHGVGGLEADIAAMPSAHPYAQTFATRWYRPENARLVLAGDVSASAIDAVRKHFDAWSPPALPEEERVEILEEPVQVEGRRVDVPWDPPTHPRLLLAWKVPPARIDADRAALQAVQALQFGAKGRLQNRLVREEALAYGVRGGSDDRFDAGLYTIHVRAKRAEDLERIEAIVLEELERLRTEPPADQLEAAKTQVHYRTLTSLDRPSAVGRVVERRLRLGGTIDDLDAADKRFAEVGVADIQRVIGAYLTPERCTTAVLTGNP